MFCVRRTNRWWCVLLAIWGLAVGTGLLLLGAYAARPGDAGTPPFTWPRATGIAFDDHRWNLLLFIHAECPCSRASVEELAYIMARVGDRICAHAVLLGPEPGSSRLAVKLVLNQLCTVPKLHIWQDEAAVETQRFRVATSGHVLLYDSQGRLAFSGGITPARGHVGQNHGRDAIVARVQQGHDDQSSSPVFGCWLTPVCMTKPTRELP
jgi:hypothetical protein